MSVTAVLTERRARRMNLSGPLAATAARELRRAFLENIPPQPAFTAERGIVICGGGEKYLPSAWVLVNELAVLGNRLPVQLWYLGEKELSEEWRQRMAAGGIECVDALQMRAKHPARILNGWELKPYAMLHSPFREAMLLDADNVPVRDPAFLFDAPPYQETGAIFWPDLGRLGPDKSIWDICGVEYRDEPEFESGQIVVHKERCWRELNLTMHLNEYSDFYYRHIHGDKDTFHMAWRMLHTPYAMPEHPVTRLRGVLCQYDFDGERLFQHSAGGPKWKLQGNESVPGFIHWERCIEHLDSLTLPVHASFVTSRYREIVWAARRRLARYSRLLASRRPTMFKALDILAASPSPCIIELGITRSFVSGGRPGCMSTDLAWWKPDQPEWWDWGAGSFTKVMLEALQGHPFRYIGVDPNSEAHHIAETVVSELAGAIEFRLAYAESFLSTWDGSADLIYFDYGECTEETAQQYASDALIVVRRNLVRPGGVVLLDDHDNHTPGHPAPTKYALPIFLTAGYRVLLSGSQLLLQAPLRPESSPAYEFTLSAFSVTEMQARLVRDWHRSPPETHGVGIQALVMENQLHNFVIWHEEDKARRDDQGDARVREAKRAIDRHNQRRNDCIEALDREIAALLPPPSATADVNSESPGMVVDRLSIMALREYHLAEKMSAMETVAEVREECHARLKMLRAAIHDLGACFNDLIERMATGKRRCLPFRALKLYDDPRFSERRTAEGDPA